MKRTAATAAICLVLFSAVPARACNVPVFRYALEHWAAEPYQVTLYHHGPLATGDLVRISALELASPDRVRFHSIDLAAQPSDVRPVQLPWLVVGYPASASKSVPVWDGPLTDETAASLLDSPKRRELVQRLLAGDTAVWLLLESGRPDSDDATAHRIEAASRHIEATLRLPALSKSAEDRIRADVVPLRLSFSGVRVSRTDPAERLLVRMLLGSEPDLDAMTGPLVFPVFGRGRALYALAGAGISEANLTKAAEFLIASCSCKVKEAHPGVDLLLSADWPAAPDGATEETTAQTVEPETVPLPGGRPKATTAAVVAATPLTDAPDGQRGWLLGGIIAAALVTLVTGRMVWRGR
jgi:hypothetical protein